MTDTSSSIPNHSSDTPAAPLPETDPQPKRSRTRALLIGGGAVLAGLVLVGGGVAVGAAIADDHDDDDDRDSSAVVDDDRQDGAAPVAAADRGTASADDLVRIVAQAGEVADGDAVAIEAERDGAWDVTLVTAAGDETEVRVPSSGAVTVLSTEAADADDTRPSVFLDDATIDSLVTAALADTGGRIVQLEVDDDSRGAYDVVVVSTDGRVVDIDLDADLQVTSSRVDD